jgi:DNA-binding transcriptional MocR family regulator
MQLLLILPDGTEDTALADAARGRGIRLSALSPLHLTADSRRGLLLGYGRVPEPSIPAAVAALSEVVLAA